MTEDAPPSSLPPAVNSDAEFPSDGKKKVIHAKRPNSFYWNLKVSEPARD